MGHTRISGRPLCRGFLSVFLVHCASSFFANQRNTVNKSWYFLRFGQIWAYALFAGHFIAVWQSCARLPDCPTGNYSLAANLAVVSLAAAIY